MSTVIRGATELSEVRELFAHLEEIEAGLGVVNRNASGNPWRVSDTIVLTHEEVKDVLTRRRDAVLLKLSNKGIEVRPDAVCPDVPGVTVLGDISRGDLQVITDLAKDRRSL